MLSLGNVETLEGPVKCLKMKMGKSLYNTQKKPQQKNEQIYQQWQCRGFGTHITQYSRNIKHTDTDMGKHVPQIQSVLQTLNQKRFTEGGCI